MTRRTTTACVSRVAALLAACALAASLASCGRSDPVQEEIDRVSIGLGAVSTSGSTPLPSVENRKDVYVWAIARLTGSGSGNISIEGLSTTTPAPSSPAAVNAPIAGQAAAANLLVARGHAGLGEISAQEAAQLEAGATLQISPISAALDQWLAQNAAADALSAYDPAADIAAIEKQIGEKQKLADAARANKDSKVAAIADLEGQVADLIAAARVLREQSAEVRGLATGVSETERLALLTEAVRIGREADQVEKEAANLLARIAMEKPAADNLQRGIDELTTQMQLLRTDKENLRKRADQGAAAAQRARSEAQSAATRLMQMLGQLTAAREAAEAPTTAAVSAYEKAVSSANKAGQGVRDQSLKGQSAIAAGNYQHALADVLATRARGEFSYAELLNDLANAQPKLPNASDLASKAATAADSAKAAREAAVAAFRAALDKYTSAGSGGGETQDRLEALKNAMNAILGNQPGSGEELTPIAPDAPEGEAMGADADAAAALADGATAATEDDIRAALELYIAASKNADVPAIRGFLHADGENGAEALDAAFAPIRLNAACQTAYGKSLRQTIDESSVASIKANPMIGGMIQMIDQFQPSADEVEAMSAADAEIVVASETEAIVTFPDGSGAGQDIMVKKVDGAWKVDLSAVLGAVSGSNPMMATMLKSIGTSFNTVTGKLTGGEYADADAMLIDLNKELMAAMMKAGGLGNPGGGSGGGQGGG